ncbi:WD40/YVTN/BNR-like repeat-containing protein [Nannocystaceae bacterium ST9]
MTWIPLADLIAALQLSLEKAEQVAPGGFVVADLKVEFPAVLGTMGNQVAVQIPDPSAKTEVPAQYLARITLTLNPGPTTPGVLPSNESLDSGVGWLPLYSGTTASLYGLFASSSGTLYVVGTMGTVLHSGDGLLFGAATPLSQKRLHAVWGSGSGDVSAVGRSGSILRMGSPGGAWGAVASGIDRSINAIWGDGGGSVYAVGDKGILLSSLDNGKAWVSASIGLGSNKHGIWGDHDHLFIVGTEGHIERVNRSSLNVTSVWQSSRRLHGIWAAGPDALYAIGEKGLIVRSQNGGDTWAVAPSGTTQHLYGVGGRGPEDVYVVGRGGTILHSTDGGYSWSMEESSTTEALHAVIGTIAGTLYAVGTRGIILRKPFAT